MIWTLSGIIPHQCCGIQGSVLLMSRKNLWNEVLCLQPECISRFWLSTVWGEVFWCLKIENRSFMQRMHDRDLKVFIESMMLPDHSTSTDISGRTWSLVKPIRRGWCAMCMWSTRWDDKVVVSGPPLARFLVTRKWLLPLPNRSLTFCCVWPM